jgi:hypothetical protein
VVVAVPLAMMLELSQVEPAARAAVPAAEVVVEVAASTVPILALAAQVATVLCGLSRSVKELADDIRNR